MSSRTSTVDSAVKRHTGIDLAATRAFLLNECFIPGQGFRSHYADQATVSCSTTAICMYALSEIGALTRQQQREYEKVLLGFRLSGSPQAGAFPRTSEHTASVWTTGQAVMALVSLGSTWETVKPSVEWLLEAQESSGGWNYPGTKEGHERLLYTFYPTLAIVRCRRRLGKAAAEALTGVATFLESSSAEHDEPFWIPLRRQLWRFARKSRGAPPIGLEPYGLLFENSWPSAHVNDDWLAHRFSMALMCGPNYLHLRGELAADDPLALLHIRHLADERVGQGWNDRREPNPKTWATALGMLTLHRWAQDLTKVRPRFRRLPTRLELFGRLRDRKQPVPRVSKAANALVQAFGHLRAGTADATAYQTLILDVFAFLFGEVLKEPRTQPRTFLGTLRRDVTFRNAAEAGPWFDWKSRHMVESVIIECKNQDVLLHDDLRQTACYLGRIMGRLAILACRKTSVDDAREMLNWFVNNDDKYVLVVNDETLIDWILLKDRGGSPTDAIADLYRSLQEGVQ
jgi:hypothetical protein